MYLCIACASAETCPGDLYFRIGLCPNISHEPPTSLPGICRELLTVP